MESGVRFDYADLILLVLQCCQLRVFPVKSGCFFFIPTADFIYINLAFLHFL